MWPVGKERSVVRPQRAMVTSWIYHQPPGCWVLKSGHPLSLLFSSSSFKPSQVCSLFSLALALLLLHQPCASLSVALCTSPPHPPRLSNNKELAKEVILTNK